jgi:hypothetical protein
MLNTIFPYMSRFANWLNNKRYAMLSFHELSIQQQYPESTRILPNNNQLVLHFSGPGSVVGIATGYMLEEPGIESRWGARFSAPVQTGPGAHTASCTMGIGSLPGVKSGQGVTLTPHPLLVPWSRKGRSTPLLLLWAVWPVQSLSACTRVHFTFYLFY